MGHPWDRRRVQLIGTLYVVATPIGNLEDVTLRALRVLREADLLLAEDTRRTRTLLDRHGIAARPRSLHAHNEAARSDEVLEALAAGRQVALVSDAGTPLVSDPGERLVARAVTAGHRVVPIPGASAALAALVASGLRAEAFCFVGFLPRKAGERAARLAALADRSETLILFESPRRVAGTLAELARAFGERRACVARELTKLHEELARGTLAELATRFAAAPRGEITIVVEGAPPEAKTTSPDALRERVRALLAAGGSARDVAIRLARETGAPRRAIYAIAVEESRG
jgi:16S rRNA (cytidine1402-2'-O)-methyltransferase